MARWRAARVSPPRPVPASGARGGLLGGLLFVALSAVIAEPAARAAEEPRVAVGPFNGRRASRVRGQVLRWVRAAGMRVVSWARVIRARGRGASAEAFRKAAGELGVAAFITGRVRRRGSRWGGTITVRGADGVARVAGAWQASGSRELVYRAPSVREKVLRAIRAGGSGAPAAPAARQPAPTYSPPAGTAAAPGRAAKPPPPEAAARVADAASAQAAEGQPEEPLFQQGLQQPADEGEGRRRLRRRRHRRRVRRRPRLLPLDVCFGMQILTRAFRYHDDLYGGMRQHTLGATPAIAGAIDWYPAAHFTSGIAARFGVSGSFHQAMGIAPIASNGVDFPAGVSGWSVGLLGRHRLWLVQLSARLAYGAQSFSIDPVSDADREHEIPGASFRFVQLGVRGRARIWRKLSASVRLAYLAVVGLGELAAERFFPRATAGGLDLGGELAYEVLYGFEVRLGAALRHFSLSMNPEPGDVHIVGGATDQYAVFTAGIAYRSWRPRRR